MKNCICMFSFFLLGNFLFTFSGSAQNKITAAESEKIITEICDLMFSDSTRDYMVNELHRYIEPTALESYKIKYPDYMINTIGGAYYQIIKNEGELVEVNTKTLRSPVWERKYVFKIIRINNTLYLDVHFRPDWIDPWTRYEDLN
ncbi:MAG: hypothetical protein ACJ75J_10415 [Cytophagaceae bacterium]